MRVLTPTSNEKIIGFIRTVDLASVLLAAPFAVLLRDPGLFAGNRLMSVLMYCAIGFGAGLAMVIFFRLGRNVGHHVTIREFKTVLMASFATSTLAAFVMFSFDRLDSVPRSLPLIHVLVLIAFMLAGRMLVLRRDKHGSLGFNRIMSASQHVLIIGANRKAYFYLRMLEAFDDEETNIVGILDDDSKLIGRSVFGHPVIARRSALQRVTSEYRMHGVVVDRILVTEDRHKLDPETWQEIEKICLTSNIALEFLGENLVIELGDPIEWEPVTFDTATPDSGYRSVKRAFDLLISLAVAFVLVPIIGIVLLGILVDLGWPILFWQKRIGYLGRPFLIFKFRTLYAPFDRHGEYVEEDKRLSRFGDFLRYSRLDELPQLWNIMTGDMSFVGPRPLLPVDQPRASKHRLLVRPGLTGWAQIHGGKQIGADEKGELDDWYVENASLWLDIWIIWRTAWIVLLGDKRIETMSPFGSARKTASVGEGRLSGSQAVGAVEDLIPQELNANDRRPGPPAGQQN